MTGKTKAAMPGRLSLNALLKHRQITRLAAGGQTLSQRNPYAQINRVRLTYGHRNPLKELDYNESLESAGNKHEQYSGSPEHQHCLGSEVPTKNVESCEDNQPSLRGEAQRLCGSLCPAQDLYTEINGAQDLQVTKCHLQNRLSQRESVDGIAGSNPFQPFGSSFASLRWRRLISPCMAELMNCPVLSPGFFTCSMPSMISCAMRAVTDCDFAFFEPVAMSTFSKNECKTLYTKIYCLEVLTCKTPLPYRVSYTLFELRCENSEARQCGNTNRASDHQDS